MAKRTRSRGADVCYTDEAARRREAYRDRTDNKKRRRKQGKKQENAYHGVDSNSFPSLLQSRAGDLVTRSAIVLLSSTAISSVRTAAVEPPPP